MSNSGVEPAARVAGAQIWSLLDWFLKWIMAALLFVMMSITFFDVIGRFILKMPIPGGFEIVQYMMALVIMAGLAQTTMEESHLSVSLFTSNLGRRGFLIHRAIILCITAIGIGVVAWRVVAQAIILQESKQVSGFLNFPLQYVGYGMALLAVLTFAIILAKLFDAITGRNRLLADRHNSQSQVLD